jgi:GMP reductase
MDYYDYPNINLVPKTCVVDSRSNCNTDIKLGKYIFKLPVVPANMECIIDEAIATSLAKNGYFYIHHRFNIDTLAFARHMKDLNLPISISLGVNDDAYELIDVLISNNLMPDFVTIDIAHGHSIKMKKILEFLKEKPNRPFIIAGNVSTAEGVKDLEAWGADAIKVGIGPGAACTTYVATGFGSRGIQASIVNLCSKAKVNPNTLIVADGGIKEPGDIAKSLALGADLVMIGGMFSGLKDSPGNTVTGTDGRIYKEFWGSASAFQSGKKHRIEGTKKLVLMKQHGFLEEMAYLTECLQSAISYGGGYTLACLKSVTVITKVNSSA